MRGDVKRNERGWNRNVSWQVETEENKFVEFDDFEHTMIFSELLKVTSHKHTKKNAR